MGVTLHQIIDEYMKGGMKKTTIENVLAKAKEASAGIDMDWMKSAKEHAVSVRSSGGDRNPRLDLRQLGGTQEDPVVIEVEFLTQPRTIQTTKMPSPMDVCDVKVIQSSVPELAKPGETYSVWANTTGLAREFNKIKLDQKFIIASHGKVRTKKKQDFYVFNFIEEA